VRFAIAAVLAVHGFAHLVGFVVSWRIASLDEMPYKTTILAGKLDVGDTGIRVVGMGWLLAAMAFFASAAALILQVPWWFPATVVLLLSSVALCVIGWPDAKIGVFVNLALLAIFTFGQARGWPVGVAN
jgi:hypothetical protein